MKRLCIALAIGFVALALTGCGKDTPPPDGPAHDPGKAKNETPPPPPPPAPVGKKP